MRGLLKSDEYETETAFFHHVDLQSEFENIGVAMTQNQYVRITSYAHGGGLVYPEHTLYFSKAFG